MASGKAIGCSVIFLCWLCPCRGCLWLPAKQMEVVALGVHMAPLGVRMAPVGAHVASYGAHMVQCHLGSKWPHWGPYGTIGSHAIWVPIWADAIRGSTWPHWWSIWHHWGPYGPIGCSLGFIWGPYGPMPLGNPHGPSGVRMAPLGAHLASSRVQVAIRLAKRYKGLCPFRIFSNMDSTRRSSRNDCRTGSPT